jgi:hypothetical protein
MIRTDLLNKLAKRISAVSYLEVGTASSSNFPDVQVQNKIGVDPNPRSRNATVQMTSDAFFAQNEVMFDLVFIDGLHKCEQVYKDIMNANKFLKSGGVIMCHDMNPTSRIKQAVPREQSNWNGDCWKAWVKIRTEINWAMHIVNKDQGCGIIVPWQSQPLLDLSLPDGLDSDVLNYSRLAENRQEWLNLKGGLEEW